MEIFAEDVIIGDFKLSDYGLILASFNNNSETTEDIGMDHETIEEYIGHVPKPIFLGSQYSSKLKPTLTIVKNPCVYNDLHFTEHECREILRKLTGHHGYTKMKIIQEHIDDEIFYNVRTVSVNYQKVMGKVSGIIFSMECDSQFAWTREKTSLISSKPPVFPLFCLPAFPPSSNHQTLYTWAIPPSPFYGSISLCADASL